MEVFQDKRMERLVCKNFEELRQLEGTDLPTGNWIKVTQEMINSFAEATLDFQWIHVDVEKAKKYSPFKAPIAHGFMSVSLLSKMLENLAVCLLYTSPSPRDRTRSRMPSSA